MPKVTVHFKDLTSYEAVVEQAAKILNGPNGPPPIAVASAIPVYLSARDLMQSEVDELNRLPGVDAVPHSD